ncbi:MAG: hypothetical protein R3D84_16800 [Paracoccaceae bacterium]
MTPRPLLQFVGPSDRTLVLVELGFGFTLMTLAVFPGYAVLAASGREAVMSRPAVMAWVRRAFAASFALLGLRLATERV